MKDTINKWFSGLSKTRQSTFQQIRSIFTTNEINPSLWDELETILIQADIGIETSKSIIDSLREVIKVKKAKSKDEFFDLLRTHLISRFIIKSTINFNNFHPGIIMVVGVNGSGKTTTIAKLAHYFKLQGRTVMLAAADTYRAAADEQLRAWAERINVPIIEGTMGSDPGAVSYNAIQSAKAKSLDLLIIDTAGRMHTRVNLMDELQKVHRVISKSVSDAPHACWLVIDAVAGQNAFNQAQYFKDAVHVDGVILSKLDLTARGGMAIAIQEKLNLPIVFVGLGEDLEDLQPFNPEFFVDSLLCSK